MKIARTGRLILFLCSIFLSFISVVHAATTRVVLRENVNVRLEPNVNSEILVRLNTGHRLKELQKRGYWYKVEPVGISQIQGWVFGSLVGAVDDYHEPLEKKGGVVVAQMGEDVLFEEELDSFLALLDEATRKKIDGDPDLLKNMVQEEIVRKKIIQEAIKQGFDLTPRTVSFMERARTQALAEHFLREQSQAPADFPSAEQIKEVYDRNIEKYKRPKMFHVAQIYIDVPFGLEEGQKKDLQEKAMEVFEMAKSGESDFAVLAAEYSEHLATAQAGGDLGWIEASGVAAGMRKVFSGMERDSVSAPYHSKQGWHIFKMLDRQESKITALSEVAAEIRDDLRRRKLIANRELYLLNIVEKEETVFDEVRLQGKIDAQF